MSYVTTGQSVSYRFYDLRTYTYLGDLPLKGVQCGQRLNVAGSLNGTLPLDDPRITDLHPLAATQPSRTLVVIDVNGSIIWAGILWTRQYQRTTHALDLGGQEAYSYFGHRVQAKDYTQTWATVPADAMVIARQIVQDALAVSGSAFAGMAVNLRYQEPNGSANFITGSWPITQLQTVDSILQNLMGMGYGVGFDLTIDWAYGGAQQIPVPTMNLWYPRAGAISGVASSIALLDTTEAYEYTFPEDGTTQANKVYVSGSSALNQSFDTAVDDPSSLAAGYPLLEEVASFTQVNSGDQLSALASGELATHTKVPVSPTVDVDPFGAFAIGAFGSGDDIRWVVPAQDTVPPVDDERFPGGYSGNF